MLQPMLQLFAGKGIFGCTKYRIISNSWTALQAKGGTFWGWIEFFIQAIVLFWYLFLTVGDAEGPHANPGKKFALDIVDFFGVQRDELNFFKDYGGEANMNVVLAGLVEAFLGCWAVYMIQQYIIARKKKTQESMDEWTRLRNHALMPYAISDSMRILAFIIWWTSIFQGVALWGFIYFVIQNFVSRSNMMGRVEPGPPTKSLQYRICFHVYLPFHMLLRLLLGIQMYAAVPLAIPYKQPFGNGDEWVHSWSHSAPQGFHFFYSIFLLALMLIALPLYAHRRAVALGVLTPWQMFKMAFFVGDALDDEGFATTARVAVGTHHLTSGAHFGDDTSAADEQVELPTDLRDAALYQPSTCINLLPSGAGMAPRSCFGC